MQKISTYLYPNRVQLLADLAGFDVEYTNVYQRIVKIYNGIDNTIEFDIKNADQKRIELVSSPVITQIELNVMDVTGKALPNSPYTVTPHTTLKGIAVVTIPQEDLVDLDEQFLVYSVTALKDGHDVMLYGDSRFGATGKMELVGSAMPVIRDDRVYTSFTAEIDLKGTPTNHSSAIPSTFYEAVPTETISFDVSIKGFTGSVWVEATKASTISAESFKHADYLASTTVADFTGNWTNEQPIGEYKYFRVSYSTPHANGIGSSYEVTRSNGSYSVVVRSGGTGYSPGSQMKVLGSVLGGVDGVNDLILTVTHTDATSAGFVSSYSVSSVTAVSWTGIAETGTATYIVTGNNITGTVDKITVS